MELTLKRTWLTPRSTIGELSVDGVFECFILEDRYRPPPEVKVPSAENSSEVSISHPTARHTLSTSANAGKMRLMRRA